MATDLVTVKQVIWHRRYKAWRQWFYALVLVAGFCVWKNNVEFFQLYAMWSTLGLIALIGGLSATDIWKMKNGGGAE